jgi:hypothetical protein
MRSLTPQQATGNALAFAVQFMVGKAKGTFVKTYVIMGPDASILDLRGMLFP